jgi:serine/threonine protein kinase
MLAGVVLSDLWKIENLIGEGACAKVYKVTLAKGSAAAARLPAVDYDLVAKVVPLSSTATGGTKKAAGVTKKEQARLCNTLYYEYVLYTGMLYGFPCMARRPDKFYGEDKGVRYLVMEKLDTDLLNLARRQQLSVSTVGNIGLQMLAGLRWLHAKRFLFIDVKPDNFMMKADKLYFVDCKYYLHYNSFNIFCNCLCTILFMRIVGLVERMTGSGGGKAAGENAGTPSYWSLNVHRGGAPTPNDEIEAMVYVLISLFNECRLPWSTAGSDAEQLRQKEAADMQTLTASYDCPELWTILQECRLPSPNYDSIQTQLERMASRKVTEHIYYMTSLLTTN